MLNEEEDILNISNEIITDQNISPKTEPDIIENNDPYRDLEKNEPVYVTSEENILNLYLNSIVEVFNQVKNEVLNPTSYLRQNTTQIKNRVISWFGIKEENKKY